MKQKKSLWTSTIALAVLTCVGCEAPVPQNPITKGSKAYPQMAEQRIAEIQANPHFTQDQKDQMIATVKQRNHMQ